MKPEGVVVWLAPMPESGSGPGVSTNESGGSWGIGVSASKLSSPLFYHCRPTRPESRSLSPHPAPSRALCRSTFVGSGQGCVCAVRRFVSCQQRCSCHARSRPASRRLVSPRRATPASAPGRDQADVPTRPRVRPTTVAVAAVLAVAMACDWTVSWPTLFGFSRRMRSGGYVLATGFIPIQYVRKRRSSANVGGPSTGTSQYTRTCA